MSQKIETNSRLNANMASNSSQSKSVTFDLDNMNSSGYNESSQNQITGQEIIMETIQGKGCLCHFLRLNVYKGDSTFLLIIFISD